MHRPRPFPGCSHGLPSSPDASSLLAHLLELFLCCKVKHSPCSHKGWLVSSSVWLLPPWAYSDTHCRDLFLGPDLLCCQLLLYHLLDY